ncbi:GFA family protein [Marinovum sp.]|uniref:GFA family protein n=1 Tax=Marinovum sp. TaxID=2024839 RepID=UPI002B27C1A4|nr:GFA family protein [Marinovum sp.]
MTETSHDGACHCGAVRFTVRLARGLATAARCDCSFCRMRGAVALTAAAITFHQGRESLTLYQFGSRTARHFFCPTCGIYTHHERRFPQGQLAVNAACLAGVSPFDFTELPVSDGRAHPSDNDGKDRIAGVLRFTPAG